MANLQARIEISADAEAAKSAARETRREFAELNRQLADISAYEAQEKALADTAKALEDARLRQAELGKAVTDSGGKEAVAAYKKVTAEVEKLSTSLQDQEQKLKASGAALKRAGIDSKDLASAQSRIATAMDATKAKLAEQTAVINRAKQATQDYQTLGVRSHAAIQAEIDKTRQAYIRLQASGTASSAEMRQALDAMRSKTAALKGEMQGVAPASASAAEGLGSLAAKAKAFVAVAITAALTKAVTAMESLKATMTSTFGSMEAANREMGFTAQLAQRLGADVLTLSSSYNKLAASTRGTVLEGQRTRELFEGFAVAMAKAGASSSDLDGAMTQLSQAMGKGKADLQDVKSIMEKIPGSGKLFSDALGVSTQGLYDMISAGELGREELEKIGQELKKVYDDGSKVEGLSQSWQRFTNIMTIGTSALSDTSTAGRTLAVALESVNKVVAGAIVGIGGLIIRFEQLGKGLGAFAALAAGGTWQEFKQNISEASDDAAQKISNLADKVYGLVDDTAKIPPAAGAAAEGINQTGQAAQKTAKQIKEAQDAFKLLGVEMLDATTGATESGQKIVDAFKQVAESAQNSQQVLAAYSTAMQKVGDDSVAQALLQEQLKAALDAGTISLEQHNLAMGQASMSTAELEQKLDAAAMAFNAAQAGMQSYAQNAAEVASIQAQIAEKTQLLIDLETLYQELLLAGGEGAEAHRALIEQTRAELEAMNAALEEASAKTTSQTEAAKALADAQTLLKDAIKDSHEAMQAQMTLSQGQMQLDMKAIDLKQVEAQKRLAVAKARGDEKGIQQAQHDLAQLEIERINVLIKAKEREAEVVRKKVELARMEAELDGIVTEQERRQIEIAEQKLAIVESEIGMHKAAAAAKEEVIKATERAEAAERSHGAAVHQTTGALRQQAAAAGEGGGKDSYKDFLGGSIKGFTISDVKEGSIDWFKNRLEKEQIGHLLSAYGNGSNLVGGDIAKNAMLDEDRKRGGESRRYEQAKKLAESYEKELRERESRKNQPRSEPQQTQVQPTRVVRFELSSPSGQRATVDAMPGSEAALESWLKSLETGRRVAQ
jgi:tape measure domain-containing protein